MSGIEVAGIILGVIPLLVEGLGTYKKGIKSIRTGFQKKKEVEKLCRALRHQQRLLEELLKSVLLHSGCLVPSEFSGKTQLILLDPELQAAVREYLGENYDVLIDALQECEEVIEQLVHKITKLVPSIKASLHYFPPQQCRTN
jgi:hypothetical protein